MEDATTKALRRQLDEAQEEIERLRQHVPQSGQYDIPTEWCLSPSQIILLCSLLDNKMCSKDKMLDDLCTMRISDNPDRRIIDQHVFHMRRRLVPHGLNIITIWGRGYYIEDREVWRARLLVANDNNKSDDNAA